MTGDEGDRGGKEGVSRLESVVVLVTTRDG